jgi:hypothetical protein
MAKNDFKLIADYVNDEWASRRNKRHELEKEWKEIDRQVAMMPKSTHKLTPEGLPDPQKRWMPEIELPLQAQTLEVLTADALRMELPDTGLYYSANAEMTDDYLAQNDLTSIITGDKAEVPSHLDQDNINKLVEGAVAFWHRQYDFRGHLDRINTDVFKYGTGIGRTRRVRKSVFLNTAQGIVKENKYIPVLMPSSLKRTYLDDTKSFLLNEGYMMGPAVIFHKTMKAEDIHKAASMGSNDPNSEQGGWIPSAAKGLEGDKNGEVDILEFEGDLLLPKSRSGSIHVPNCIVTIVKGQRGGKAVNNVIRYRKRHKSYSTYIEFPYHNENIDSPYSSSPLIKGWPIQMAATDALLQMMIAAQINTLPPIRYDSEDQTFMANGGPAIFPGAQWPTIGAVDAVQFGDPNALFNIYVGLLQQYADVTGVNAPRLGQQTLSHTTAYAKEAELNRGVVRTVDFVKSTLAGPLTQWLYQCYDLGREGFDRTTLFIDSYGGFVDIDKKFLPKNVSFIAHGAGGPQEEQAKINNRLQSVQTALALEQIKMQAQAAGQRTTLNLDAAITEILRQGGWTDVDVITNAESVSSGSEPTASMAGNPQNVNAAPGAALQAVQAITGQ